MTGNNGRSDNDDEVRRAALNLNQPPAANKPLPISNTPITPLPPSTPHSIQLAVIMIPGLEYEPANAGGHTDPSYASSPSAQSMSSVDMSPQGNSHNDQYHLQQLHRRRPHSASGYGNGNNTNSGYNGNGDNTNGGGGHDDDKYAKRTTRAVRNFDIFPKTERDYTVRTERGGQLTAVGYVIMAILILAEWMTWRGLNGESLEHIVVDTR